MMSNEHRIKRRWDSRSRCFTAECSCGEFAGFGRTSAEVSLAVAAHRHVTGTGLEPIHPVNPSWCMRDHGCILLRGHEGECDLTGSLFCHAGKMCMRCAREFPATAEAMA